MPIEIKELVIKAVVASGNDEQPDAVLNQADILRLKKEITKEVTERVLKTLHQKSER